MHGQTTRWLFIGLACLVGLPSCAVDRQSYLDSLPRSTSPGQVAQAVFPLNEVLSTQGPAINIGNPVNVDVSALTVVEADLAARIRACNLQIARIRYSTSSLNDADKQSVAPLLTNKVLTADMLADAATKLQAVLQAKNQLNAIRFGYNDTTGLLIQLTPVIIDKLSIQDGKHVKARAIQHQLAVKPNQPLPLNNFKRQLQHIMDNPDISLSASLEPVEMDQPDNPIYTLNIKIDDTLPHHVSGYFSNIDQFDYGETISGFSILSNNATGVGDTLAVLPILDRYTQGLTAHYEIPLGQWGTRLRLDSTLVKVSPKTHEFRQASLRGEGWTVSLGLYQPLVSRPDWRLSGDASFELQQVSTHAKYSPYGRLTVEQENLRNLRLGLQWDHTGDYGTTLIRHEWTQGLDILGASPNRSAKLPVAGGGSQYSRYIGTLAFEKALPKDFSFTVNAQAQWSPNSLPSFQQYGAGGTFTGRGYKEVFIPADTALFASGQLNIPTRFIPERWTFPWTKTTVRDSLRFLVFTDYAWAKLNDRKASNDPTEHLCSIGVGARLKINKYVTCRVDVGFPILRNPPFNQTPRVHFGLIGSLF